MSVKLANQEEYFSSMHDSQSRATEMMSSKMRNSNFVPEFGKNSNVKPNKDYLDEDDFKSGKR